MESTSNDNNVERKPHDTSITTAEETIETENRDHRPSRRDSRNRSSKGLSRSPNERRSSSRRLSRNRDAKGPSRSSHHEKESNSSSRRLSSSRKHSEKSEKRSSSRRRRHSNANHRQSAPHRRPSSAQRPSLKSFDRTRSSRHKYSSTRPSRSKSLDDSWDGIHNIETSDADGNHNMERRISKEKSQRRRRSRDGDHDHDRSQSNDAMNALYGDDEDAKMKSSKETSRRAIVPGVEHVGSKSNRTTTTLYGHDDSDAKAKAIGASSHRAKNPGVEQIDNNTNRSVTALYGNTDGDGKAKAKASSSEPAKTPGIHQVAAHLSSTTTMHSADTSTLSDPDAEGATTNTLYGNEADAKAKASRMEPATSPGVDRVFSRSSSSVWKNAKKSRRSLGHQQRPSSSNHTTTTTANTAVDTLYGENDADAKAKAKASKGSSSNPGVETILVNNSMHTATSTLYGSEADSKAKLKASGGSSILASNPGAASATSMATTVDTLYGNDVSAKGLARAGGEGAASYAAVPGVASLARNTMDDGEHETMVEEPVARAVSVDMGTTDSESDSVSEHEPERNMDAGGNRLSSEARENLQLPNDPEAPSRKHDKSEKNGADDKEGKKRRKKRCILWLLFFVLLLIGAGVAVWYFLVRNDGSVNSDTPTGMSSSVQDPTQSPASSTGSSFMPTLGLGNSTVFPSSAPSLRFIYEPPSESDCLDIAANQTIAGREEKENADFELGVEVVPVANTTLTEPLLEALLDAIQQKILPSLAGCSIIIDELVEAWRFVIFDAFVTGSVPNDESCSDEDLMQLHCHRVAVKLDLFLKGSVRFLDIIALISDQGDNIANHLELEELFSYIKLTGAESLIPTDAPTRMPSATPSFTPTQFPTATASSKPTGNPTVLPTRAPTRKPSVSPTMVPSEAPSMSPSTTPPTGFPSEQPSLVPSDNPSVRPTTMFSGTPTEQPTVAPSARPTAAPTKSPTVMPSHLPSSLPTDRPSLSPSYRPTNFPTFAPSSQPSTFPSTLPTPRPSAFPTPVPTYATEIITQAYGPYTNYPVSQSSIGWGGDPIRAIDGNNSGIWGDRSITHTLNGPNQWWQVDLATGAGRPAVVKYITVWNRTNCCTQRLIGAVVQLLDAGQNDITPAGVDNVLIDKREQTIDFGLVSNVSFVKIGKDNILSLAEVEIYGYVPL